MPLRFVIFCLIACLSKWAWSQSGTLSPFEFVEQLQTQVPVSGNLVRAIQIIPATGLVDLDKLNVFIPESGYTTLCLDITSQDGRYTASAVYNLNHINKNQRYRITFGTSHRNLLESKPVRDLAMLAFLANTCSAGQRHYLPILSDDATADSPLLFLVNARTPNISVRIYDVATKQYYTCDRDRQSDSLVAYDLECEVNRTNSLASRQYIVVRNRFEQQLDNVTIEAVVP